MLGPQGRGAALRVRVTDMAARDRPGARVLRLLRAAVTGLVLGAALLAAAGGAGAATYVSRATGNWNATATWAELRTGTITTSTASPTVTGVGTLFLTQLANGNQLYTASGALIGTVLSRTNDTTLTLTANALSNNSGIPYYRGATATPIAGDTVTVNSHIVTVSAAHAAATVTVNAGGTLNTTNALTVSGAASVSGNMTVGAATTTLGSLSIPGGGVFNANNDTIINGATTVTGTLNIANAAGTIRRFIGAVTVTGIWNNSVNEPAEFRGGIGFTGTTFTAGTGVHTFNTNPQNISGNAISIPSVTVAGVTLTNQTTLTIATALTGTGGLTNAASRTLNLGMTAANLTITTLTAGAADNTVVYNGAAQTIKVPNASNYYNLTLSGSGNKDPVNAATYNILGDFTVSAGVTWRGANPVTDPVVNVTGSISNSGTAFTTGNGNYAVTGNLTTSAGTFTTGTGTFSLSGDFTFSGGTFTTGTGAFIFTGGNAQALTGTTNFVNLRINKSGNTLTLNNNVTATTTLNLQAGTVTTGLLTLTLAPAVAANGCSTAGALVRTTGYVIGNLQYKFIAGNSTCIFHIGDAGAYTPVTVAMRGASGTPANNLITARMDTPDHAGVTSGAAGIDPSKSVNRYWTLTGGGAWVFGTGTQYDATFRFQGVGTDADAGSTTANFEVSRLTGGAWFGTPPGTRTGTTTQTLEQAAFGIFAVGELVNIVFAEYRMEEAAGLLGQIADSSGNNRHGVRVGTADTVSPSPTNPSVTICRALNIPNNAALATRDALDTSVDMNEVGERGTVTFWYKSTTIWNTGGIRQLLDASSSATAIFSLVLLNNGRLEFRISDTAGVTRSATQNATSGIAANTWAHIGVTWNFQANTLQIFVNGAAVAATSAGAPNGALASLLTLYAGDNRGAGYAPPGNATGNSANGNIDELRIYRGVRTAAQILADRNTTYPAACDVTQLPGRFNAFETSLGSVVTGSINTKVSGANATVKLVAVNTYHTAIETSFGGTARIELLDATNSSGALDANKCRSTWTPITSPAPTLPNAVFAAGISTPYTFVVPDAYKNVRLRVSYPAAAPVLIGCTTDNFAVRPASLVSIAAQDETWETAYTGGTPRSLDNSGTVHKAGRPFTISATAMNGAGVPVATANYDGSPTVAGSMVLLQPDPVSAECTGGNPACVAGTLTPGAWSAIGSGVVRTTTASYDNVGVFQAQFEDTTYANVDVADTNPASTALQRNVPASSSVTFGRFVPDHFLLTVSQAPVFQTFGADDTNCSTPAAGSKRRFTYIGQAFNWQTRPRITVTAERFGGGTTSLYRGALFKVTTADITYAYSGGATFTATPDTAGILIVMNHDGTGTVSASTSDTFRYTRDAATPQAAFNAAISLNMDAKDVSESDGTIASTAPVTFNGSGSGILFDGGDFDTVAGFTGGRTFVYGRLSLGNASGSQLVPLQVPMTTDYWVEPSPGKSYFARNAADHCTTLAAANVGIGNFKGLVSGDTTASIPTAAFRSGLNTLVLSAPGGTKSGSVDLVLNLNSSGTFSSCITFDAPPPTPTFANLVHLRGKWCGANYDRDPTGRARFGVFKGAEEVIFIRENF